MSTPEPAILRIVFAIGTSPEKWFRRFRDWIPATLHTHIADDSMSGLVNGVTDIALVRLESKSSLPESLHRIRLHDEAWGMTSEKEHVLSLAEPVPEELLTDETMLLTSVDTDELRQMLPVAATGAGIVAGPRAILKALSKKTVASSNLVAEEGVADPLSRTAIWLVQPEAEDDELRQEFVNVVQGRKERSTCTQLRHKRTDEAPKKLSIREKTLVKQACRQCAGTVVKRARGGRGGRRSSGGSGRPRRRK